MVLYKKHLFKTKKITDNQQKNRCQALRGFCTLLSSNHRTTTSTQSGQKLECEAIQMKQGLVFNVQKYSVHDGPGIRTTVFLKGCPLRCKWCHNPEGLSSEPELVTFQSRCLGCGICVQVCPKGAIWLSSLNSGDSQSVPDAPGGPHAPDNPDTPDTPDTPDAPDAPNVPGVQDAPHSLDAPDTSDAPDVPHAPDTPSVPGAQDTPDVPHSPHAQGAADVPDAQGVTRATANTDAPGTTKRVAVTDRGKCNVCGKCADLCPTQAREITGKLVTPDWVIEQVLKDRVFYEQSGGGVTFSGGEPLMQPEFLLELLKRCKAEGIHTAVDTSGYVPWESIEQAAPFTDLFLYDIKMMDPARHMEYTGVSNGLILDNLAGLSKIHNAIIARIPVIPGVNDDASNIESTGELLAQLGIMQASILPYHDIGSDKYGRLGKHYALGDTAKPSDEAMSSIKEILERFRLSVKIGG